MGLPTAAAAFRSASVPLYWAKKDRPLPTAPLDTSTIRYVLDRAATSAATFLMTDCRIIPRSFVKTAVPNLMTNTGFCIAQKYPIIGIQTDILICLVYTILFSIFIPLLKRYA
jgi:hypothetical protein